MLRGAGFSVVLWAGCYAPRPPAGAPCSTDGSCPTGERCVAGTCGSPSSTGGGGGDLPQPDAAALAPDAAIDAAVMLDAPGLDPSCATDTTCIAAPTLGAISGDTGHQTLHATGSTAAWIRVRVTEDNNDFWGKAVRVQASLTPPAAGAFAVQVYVNAAEDMVECATTIGTHSTSGDVEIVRAGWGETVFSNGVNDGRDVSIAIVPTGSCAPEATWDLTLEGNWN